MILPVRSHAELNQRLAHESKILADMDRRLARNRPCPPEVCACRFTHGAELVQTKAHGRIPLLELRNHYARALCILWELECKAAGLPTGMELSGVGRLHIEESNP